MSRASVLPDIKVRNIVARKLLDQLRWMSVEEDTISNICRTHVGGGAQIIYGNISLLSDRSHHYTENSKSFVHKWVLPPRRISVSLVTHLNESITE